MFEKMSQTARLEAFEVLIKSIDLLLYGFDWVDGERFQIWLAKLNSAKRQELYSKFGYEGRLMNGFIDIFYDRIDDRKFMWQLLFEKLSPKRQIEFLESNRKVYEQTIPLIQKEPFDWSTFTCKLVEEGQIAKLQMITHCWNEVGMQVYDGCRINGRLCPCLREATNTSAFKCFKNYLKEAGLDPFSRIPRDLLQG